MIKAWNQLCLSAIVNRYFKQQFYIGDCTTWGCCRMHTYIFFTRSLIFLCPRLFDIMDINIPPALMNVRFDLSAPNPRITVLVPFSNASENWQSDFFVLGFLTVTDWLVENVLLSVYTSVVDTIATSIMALYYCWSSHLTAYLYNLFIFPYIYDNTLHCY